MKSYFGTYSFPGQSDVAEATVLVFDKNISIGYKNNDGGNVMINWGLKDVIADVHFGFQNSVINNRQGGQGTLNIEGKEAAEFIRSLQDANSKPWHRKPAGREWIRNGLLLVGILTALFLLYLLLVPWMSEKLASKVSIKTERQLGDAVYGAMQLSSTEDQSASIVLNEFFSEMEVKTDYPIRITAIQDNTVNAFALPGGRIVVYTGLLEKVESYPELAALLLHEFVHINNRHSTKSIFRKLGSKVFISLLFGQMGTVTAVLMDNADDIKSLSFSRRLEKEADLEGLSLLMQRKIDPSGFRELFVHLREASSSGNVPEFLASHPDIDNRIDYVSEASSNASKVENARLKAIFDKLK